MGSKLSSKALPHTAPRGVLFHGDSGQLLLAGGPFKTVEMEAANYAYFSKSGAGYRARTSAVTTGDGAKVPKSSKYRKEGISSAAENQPKDFGNIYMPVKVPVDKDLLKRWRAYTKEDDEDDF